jgi:hypothetical protein
VTGSETPAGWYPDPQGGHQHRYWDGNTWTDQVADSGVAQTDVAVAERTEPAEAVAEPAADDNVKPATNAVALIVVLVAGAATSLFFGAYGRIHDPTGETTLTLFFTSTISLKVWFTTVAIVFALIQILTALRLYGKIKVPHKFPKWLGDVHRLSGTLAFVFTLPVAFHCLWALGFASDASDPRTYIHSIAGCAFYGLFVVKVLSVRIHDLPKWLLPVAGSVTFAALIVLWSTSSLWYWQNVSFPGV